MNENEMMNMNEEAIDEINEYDDLSDVVESTDSNQLFIGLGIAAAGLIGLGVACRGKIKKKITEAKIKSLQKKGYVVYNPVVDEEFDENVSDDSEGNPENGNERS